MELREVVDHLSVEFAEDFSQDTVEVTVKQTAAKWEDAPVWTFIPLLAEKAARRRLKSVLAVQSSKAS